MPAEPEQTHYFSPDEVNALIPRLEEHFQQFWSYRQNAQNILQDLRKNARDAQNLSASDAAGQQIKQSQAHFLLEQAKKQLDAILEMGCTVKDLEIGLADFPHILEYEEEEVYLCWRYGEKKVRFWHELNEGFSGRKPLVRRPHPNRP